MVSVNMGFWHRLLEKHCATPLQPPSFQLDILCKNACPHCRGESSSNFLPVNKKELTTVLAQKIVNNPTGNITPNTLVKNIKEYPSVGKLIYCQMRSMKPPLNHFIEGVVLQLIEEEIIGLMISYSLDTVICNLIVQDGSTPILT